MYGMDAEVLMHPKVWEASGHTKQFHDYKSDCKSCRKLFKVADLKDQNVCPDCGGELTAPRPFDLMFKTHQGSVEDKKGLVYLRPETAQGMFVNFLNILDSCHPRLPFGLAQIGKAFRNEITPGNFIFRTREFEQMEMQYFVKPGTDEEWFLKWKEDRMQYYLALGLAKDKLRFHEHGPDEFSKHIPRRRQPSPGSHVDHGEVGLPKIFRQLTHDIWIPSRVLPARAGGSLEPQETFSGTLLLGEVSSTPPSSR